MKVTPPITYEARFGHRAEDDSGMEDIAAYAIRGFASDNSSRFDQVMNAMGELSLPEEVDWLEMTRLTHDEAVSRINGLHVVTRSGLLATPLTLAEEPAGISQLLSGEHPEPFVKVSHSAITEELPTFPIRSIFASGEATA